MSEPIRILHIVTYMGRGGLETMIMNYYRNIDRSKVQFDFLVHREEKADYDDEIESLGGRIYRIPKLNPFSISYLKSLDSFFREHNEYRIVHCHQDCLSSIPLKYAKKHGVPFTIAHAHSSSQDKNLKYLIKMIYKKQITKYVDYLFACGNEAGKWMFNTDDFKILNNAIDTNLYTYNEERAKQIREELGIRDKFVVGHVGRFNIPKNHKFIIDIFKEIKKIRDDSVLILVGDGALREQIQDSVINMGIDKDVKFLGVRDNVADLMKAMDVFLFPSLYEGLPVTLVEAQASDLKCIISDNIPNESIILSNVKSLSLDRNAKYWAKKVVEFSKESSRSSKKLEIEEAGFDINSNAKWLEEFYIKRWSV